MTAPLASRELDPFLFTFVTVRMVFYSAAQGLPRELFSSPFLFTLTSEVL